MKSRSLQYVTRTSVPTGTTIATKTPLATICATGTSAPATRDSTGTEKAARKIATKINAQTARTNVMLMLRV